MVTGYLSGVLLLNKESNQDKGSVMFKKSRLERKSVSNTNFSSGIFLRTVEHLVDTNAH